MCSFFTLKAAVFFQTINQYGILGRMQGALLWVPTPQTHWLWCWDTRNMAIATGFIFQLASEYRQFFKVVISWTIWEFLSKLHASSYESHYFAY